MLRFLLLVYRRDEGLSWIASTDDVRAFVVVLSWMIEDSALVTSMFAANYTTLESAWNWSIKWISGLMTIDANTALPMYIVASSSIRANAVCG